VSSQSIDTNTLYIGRSALIFVTNGLNVEPLRDEVPQIGLSWYYLDVQYMQYEDMYLGHYSVICQQINGSQRRFQLDRTVPVQDIVWREVVTNDITSAETQAYVNKFLSNP
jgi:hypothetical protein